MLEAVGEAYWSTYFATLRDRLSPGGVGVLQVITIDDARFDLYRRRPDFVQKYIFPGGMLPTPQIIKFEVVKAGLQLVAQDVVGESYAWTLEEWQRRFQHTFPSSISDASLREIPRPDPARQVHSRTRLLVQMGEFGPKIDVLATMV